MGWDGNESGHRRRALLYLNAREKPSAGVPLGELKASIGADRSNARRAIRGLIERGMVEEFEGAAGERRAKLSSGGWFAMWLAGYPDDSPAFERVPSRPADTAGIFDYDEDEEADDAEYPMQGREPHGSAPSPDERAVSNNGGRVMQARMSHANGPAYSDRSVSDNDANPRSGLPN